MQYWKNSNKGKSYTKISYYYICCCYLPSEAQHSQLSSPHQGGTHINIQSFLINSSCKQAKKPSHVLWSSQCQQKHPNPLEGASFLRPRECFSNNKSMMFYKCNSFISQMHPVLTWNISAVGGHTQKQPSKKMSWILQYLGSLTWKIHNSVCFFFIAALLFFSLKFKWQKSGWIRSTQQGLKKPKTAAKVEII